MDYILNLSIEFLIIELFVWILIKKVYKLNIKMVYLILSQIPNIALVLCFLFSGLNILYLIILKIILIFLICLLITNAYNYKAIFNILGLYLLISFSIYGYYSFLRMIVISLNFYWQKNNIYFDAIFAVAFVVFYLLLYVILKSIKNIGNLKNLLADVSFCLSDNHITLKGLIDTGNSVYDKKTNLPVVLLSIDSLKKYLPLVNFSYVLEILATHCEKCVLVGGESVYIPIVSVSDCKIVKNERTNYDKFVIGVVKQKFYDEKHYDCLIHRDFI